MQRVLAHIDQHLAEPLELKTLAAVAHFSPYHFHRVFAGWMGETLGDYLRRRRLEVAATWLRHRPGMAVLAVALEVGFGSGEAFSRAFKAHFGAAPGTWRRQRLDRLQRNADQAERNPDQTHPACHADDGSLTTPTEGALTMMTVDLDTLPAMRVAGLRYTGPYGPALGEFWGRHFMPWVGQQQLLGRTQYGLSYDDPSITPPAQCRCDTVVEVPDGFVATPPAVALDLPGGPYALGRFAGDALEIGSAWRWIFKHWLPDSGLQVDDRPCFERYTPEHQQSMMGGAFRCDICIPVRPL